MNQIFIYPEFRERVFNDYITIRYSNSESKLWVTFRGTLVYSAAAHAKDIFTITAHGGKTPPVVVKNDIPKERGRALAYVLSFKEEKTFAKSYNDFCRRYPQLTKEYSDGECTVISSEDRYAFCFAPKQKQAHKGGKNKVKPPKPILAWVADDLEPIEFEEMIIQFKQYRKLYCPDEYISQFAVRDFSW